MQKLHALVQQSISYCWRDPGCWTDSLAKFFKSIAIASVFTFTCDVFIETTGNLTNYYTRVALVIRKTMPTNSTIRKATLRKFLRGPESSSLSTWSHYKNMCEGNESSQSLEMSSPDWWILQSTFLYRYLQKEMFNFWRYTS